MRRFVCRGVRFGRRLWVVGGACWLSSLREARHPGSIAAALCAVRASCAGEGLASDDIQQAPPTTQSCADANVIASKALEDCLIEIAYLTSWSARFYWLWI
ncbi:hypothetical protein AZI85_13690 [Bdellovibrio bacteriovorus]|uniref:Uncharacterized protein n=1 Tax=Bdellovibrio bacteriovorus TaxID=959 RepID=A0A150WUQ5_BDEBC|nr:hypothetical protein AZI85_13690 [Bdellovibrio bacteriovorus]